MGEWIDAREKHPEDLESVIVTFVNHSEKFKGKLFVAPAVYYHGLWYWFSSIVQDMLEEYGFARDSDVVHKSIDIIAWMPMPDPYKKGEE